MKKSLLILLVSVMGSLSYGGVLNDLGVDEDLIIKDAFVEYEISTYDVHDVSWGKEINLLKRIHGDCGDPLINVGRSQAIRKLKKIFKEQYLARELRHLIREGKIAFAIVAQDGDRGSVEYCSTTTLRIYSTDGEVLNLYFDYNT